jgi:hypothetical protein
VGDLPRTCPHQQRIHERSYNSGSEVAGRSGFQILQTSGHPSKYQFTLDFEQKETTGKTRTSFQQVGRPKCLETFQEKRMILI